ncbi:acetyltransferase [Streptomyces sp. NBC_01142]|uniref:acetyltransferase n=1 Tax=Streptomyces sp. NBC_01142 TaxID=2975865 RepID=UPI002256796D|nr:acetyltransferase [Streptomyces sp. NBC_01142]MCX4824581.1 acetyltransferase [Streptomyces sp. NBC_01142]
MTTASRPERLVLLGAGGHARELIDAIHAVNAVRPTWDLLGVLDDGDRPTEPGPEVRAPFLGPTSLVGMLDAWYVIGIGDGAVRERLDRMARRSSRTPATVVHPAASVGPRAVLGPGCYVAANATLTTDCVLGRHTHINVGASVSHDDVLGAYCTLAPGARLGGRAVLEDGVTLGLNCAVLPGVRLGAWSVAGAGATVLKDVLPGSVVAGTPAVVLRRTPDPVPTMVPHDPARKV